MSEVAQDAKLASRVIASASSECRQRALRAIADELRAREEAILDANESDVERARASGLSEAMVDRLILNRDRIEKLAIAVVSIASAEEVVGRVESRQVRPNGLRIARMRIPLGVIAMIYESRPNVTVDAAALCIKSGNAVILRGGSEASASNQALGEAVSAGLEAAGLPRATAQVIATTDRAAIDELLVLDEYIDLVIPRGGEGLIRAVAAKSRIPVLKHFKGVCHLYVHRSADLDMAMALAENAKGSRPGVCNAVETILIDREVAKPLLPRLGSRFEAIGIAIRGDETVCSLVPSATPASAKDWDTEYLDRLVSIRVVDNFSSAIKHIEKHASDHTESIVTSDKDVGREFLRLVNSSTVMVNASTRFADGGELGLGAEIGISTTKLHAYGPMGAEGLTTTKFIVEGDGQVRN